ncbi:hypothetical protein J437_LFUL002055 [Ladona fulva]|uniref:Uncharacterized protein n=1 Tax=Ladona fulva TaxID=123851 RepID=A0A8K0JWD3_LADFU|nr:hypothetical protein J437_LFUL002055 [Ladona fulva]
MAGYNHLPTYCRHRTLTIDEEKRKPRLSNGSKILVLKRKELIQKSFRQKMGLIVDVPKPGYGTSNDGNTARRFFADPKLSLEVTDGTVSGTVNGTAEADSSSTRSDIPELLVEETSFEDERQEKFSIISEHERHFKRFNMVGRELVIKLNHIKDFHNPIVWFDDAVDSILKHIKSKNVNAGDYLGLSIANEADPAKSISISFRRADQLVSDVITDTIAKVVQSNESFLVSSPLVISVHHVALPVGRGRCKKSIQLSDFNDFCRKKRSIIVINNSDSLCLARAIVVSISRHADDLATQKRVIRDVGLIQTQRSLTLC